MPAVAEMPRPVVEVPSVPLKAEASATVEPRQSLFGKIRSGWRREPAEEKITARSNETVLFDSKDTGRKIVGGTVMAAGVLYTISSAAYGNWWHAAGGALATLGGYWIWPKNKK